MDHQFWAQLIGTAVGGLVATAGAVITMLVGKRVDREQQRALQLCDAYSEWAQHMQEALSHHENYYSLAAQKETVGGDSGTKEKWKDEVIRVSIAAGEAGRRLDAAYYRVLLLESRQSFRDEVTRLTEDSKMKEIAGETPTQMAPLFKECATALRERLKALLRRLAAAKRSDVGCAKHTGADV
jgi:hypothetical protein